MRGDVSYSETFDRIQFRIRFFMGFYGISYVGVSGTARGWFACCQVAMKYSKVYGVVCMADVPFAYSDGVFTSRRGGRRGGPRRLNGGDISSSAAIAGRLTLHCTCPALLPFLFDSVLRTLLGRIATFEIVVLVVNLRRKEGAGLAFAISSG